MASSMFNQFINGGPSPPQQQQRNLNDNTNAIDNHTLNTRTQNRVSSRKRKAPVAFRNEDGDEQLANEPPPGPMREMHDSNRHLKFARNIDRSDGVSFDFVAPCELIDYLPKNLDCGDEWEYSSCDELELAEEEAKERRVIDRINKVTTTKVSNHWKSSSSSSSNESDDDNRDKPSNPQQRQRSNNKTTIFGSDIEDDQEEGEQQQQRDENYWTGNKNTQQEEEEHNNNSSEDNASNYDSEEIIQNLPESRDLRRIEQSRKIQELHKLKKGKSSKELCFACQWQDPHKVTISADSVTIMMKTMYSLYGQIRTIDLSKIIHIQFMRDIWHPCKGFDPNTGKKMLIWRTYQIYDHLKTHVQDPRFFILNSIEELKEDAINLKRMSYRYVRDEKTGNEYPDYDEKAIKLRLDINKRLMEIYSKSAKGMNFYNDKLPVNLDQAGAIINLHKNFEFSGD